MLLLLTLLPIIAAAPCCTPSTTDYNIQFLNHNLCIDNKDGAAVNGNQVQVWQCDELNPNQKWTFTPGKYPTQIKLAGTDMCLSGGDNTQNGTPLTIQSCDLANYAMTWSGPQQNRICLLGTNFCIDLTDGNASNGRTLQLWSRDPTSGTENPNQQWSWDFACA